MASSTREYRGVKATGHVARLTARSRSLMRRGPGSWPWPGRLLAIVASRPPGAESSGRRDRTILEFRRYYIEDGAPISINEMEALVATHPDLYFRRPELSPPRMETTPLAAELLDLLGTGTVVVLSPEEVGAVSTEFDEATIGDALDVMVARGRPVLDRVRPIRRCSSRCRSATPLERGGGFPWLPVDPRAIVGLVRLHHLAQRPTPERRRRPPGWRKARTEIRHQMDVIADQIVKLADDPRAEKKPEALDHYRAASETFAEAEAGSRPPPPSAALEELSDDLDRARWDLEATTALMEGRDAAAGSGRRQARALLFRSHPRGRRRGGRTPDPGRNPQGDGLRADAEKLRRGEAPGAAGLADGTATGPRSAGAPLGRRLGSRLAGCVLGHRRGNGPGASTTAGHRQTSRRSSGGLGIPFPGRSSSPGQGEPSAFRFEFGSRPRGRARRAATR